MFPFPQQLTPERATAPVFFYFGGGDDGLPIRLPRESGEGMISGLF